MSTETEYKVEIVPALGVDADAAAALHARCFDDAWQSDLIARVLGTPGGYGFLARAAGALFGFALCRSAAGEGEILTLCVDPARRRLGIGRRLLSASIEEARGRHLVALFLEVATDNDVARRLYGDFGFIQVGRRPAYYRLASGLSVDALTLRCTLQPRIARD